MIPLSCSNCCFNGLQYGSLGLSAGFCAEFQVVLRRSDETTCGRHFRKDLAKETAELANQVHRKSYALGAIQFIRSKAAATDESNAIQQDSAFIETDSIGEAVADYGRLESKIASLAQLRALSGPRAELAMLSLGRTYVRRCHERKGPWTSGLNLVWWTRKRLMEVPNVSVRDLRFQTAASMERQAELAAWSVVMLRLTFVADVGSYAPPSDPSSGLAGLAEQAAEATEVPDLQALISWIDSKGAKVFDAALPRARVRELQDQLHKESGEDS